MFIKLTESCADRSLATILVNVNFIKCFQNGKEKVDTHVAMSDGKYYFVKETIDTIQGIIKEANK